MTEGKNTPTPWKWHCSRDEESPNLNNGSIISEQREGHAYAVAKAPRFATDEQWSHDASLIVEACNSHADLKAEVATLRASNAELVAALADRENDISALLANLRHLEEAFGETLEGEDAAIVSDIERQAKDRGALSKTERNARGGAADTLRDAASDMFDVLTRIDEVMDFSGAEYPQFDGLQEQMEAAIAKAEGRS